MSDKWIERTWPLTILMAVASGGLLLDPIGTNGVAFFGIRIPSICAFRYATGLPCPLCGLTRSIVNCLRGNWHDAWISHPLGPIVLFAFALYAIFRLAYGKDPRHFERWVLGAGIIFLAVWAIRLFSLAYLR